MFSLILTHISFVYPNSGVNSVESSRSQITKSRVIIIGKSSIIIESTNNTTNLIASKIETVSGGKFVEKVVQDDENSNNINGTSETATEASVGFTDGLPTDFVIEKAFPNPFNPTTRIRYGISNSSPVNVAIYDMSGRLVSDYKIGEKAPGWHEFTWQGTDSNGQQVSTGMYLVTMRAGEYFQKQKVTFLK
ncbi:MAG: T9SS type A sorting domain-containing protein [Planctomycetia bacterium]|nr:T9SS type A sorting domain-containing protein [Planctomycetia bacterium]